jgi:predicted RNase H-like HicB family nuclease
MQISVLIEQIAGNGYRARGGEPLALTADGASQDEALANLREKLQARLSNGAVVVSLELPSQAHPLAQFAGMFKGDPLLKHWKKSMKAYRRKVDKDAQKP